ncbi:MAG: SDR family oxidoreductase [Acidobacteria bacterium]|nr:SDR family oxidoreductase [Acidobacteriota bacterium]
MPERQVVLITGARKGIGRFLAEHFAAGGAAVIGCGRTPADWTRDGVDYQRADVSSEADVKALVGHIQRAYGRLDVIVNNAGVASMNHSLLTPVATAERVLATNVTGTFLVAREGAKLMQRRRYGRIVNLTTVAVPLHLDGEAIYAASKSAVETLTKVLAHELGAFGITCNAVGPSPIATDLIHGVPAEKIEAITRRLAIKRLGRYEDVSNAIDFFVRPESDYITGQVIYLGGVS